MTKFRFPAPRIAAITVLGVTVSTIASAAPAPPVLSAKAATGTVTVTVTDLRNSKGMVRACMTRQSGKFPKCANDANSYHTVVKPSDRITFRFDRVAPGRYAIALLHDENGNGKADRALMMPTEGFGFSRDAKVRMGPPKFEEAAFDVRPGTAVQTIRMRYLL